MPIPNAEFVDYSNIVGREVRVGIFDEKVDSFVANILNLECRWTDSYEDRWYFDTHKVDNEDIVFVKIPEAELVDTRKQYSIILEFVNFVKKPNSSGNVPMSAGYSKLDFQSLSVDKTHELVIMGGFPYKNKEKKIEPEDIRHKRKGFFPSIVGMFEGQVKSKITLSSRVVKLNHANLTEIQEDLEVMPDMGICHMPQLKIGSCFRQCLGRDAFSYYGSVSNATNVHLSTEIYVNSFCNLFCIPTMASIITDFWTRNVLDQYANRPYEIKMDCLKILFNQLYPLLSVLNFKFSRGSPHD